MADSGWSTAMTACSWKRPRPFRWMPMRSCSGRRRRWLRWTCSQRRYRTHGRRSPKPKTTVSALYADLKSKRGRPWPTKLFLDSLNAALGQGFIHRVTGSGPITSLPNDGATELMIRSAAPKPPEPPPTQTPAGRRASSLAEIQDLADQIHTLSKPLAGLDPQIEVRITIKTKADGDLSLANGILDKSKTGWKL